MCPGSLASLERNYEALAEAVDECACSSSLQMPHASPNSLPGWTLMLQMGQAVEAFSSAVWTVTHQPSCSCSTGTVW